MAFPYETTHLLSHLRASYLVLADTDEYASRIIKSTEIKGSTSTNSGISGLDVPESPPITFHIARHVQKSLHNAEGPPGSKNGQRRNHHKGRRTGVRQDKEKDRRRPNTAKDSARFHAEVPRGINEVDKGTETRPISDIQSPSSISDLPIAKTTANNNEYGFDDSRGESLDYEDDVDTAQVLTNDDNESGSTFDLAYTKTIRGSKSNKRTTPGIARFFSSKAKGKEVDSDSDSDGSIKTSVFKTSTEKSLDLIEEEMNNEDVTDDGDITETEEKRKSRRLSRITAPDNSDVITIDSDFGVPVDARGQVVHNWNGVDGIENKSAEDSVPKGANEDDEDEEEGRDEDEDDFEDASDYDDYDYDDLDVSSTDSAFTDIETDSILDSSILLNSFEDSNSNSYLFDNPTAASFRLDKKSRRKKRGGSFEQHSLLKTSAGSSNFKTVSSQTSMFPPKGQSPGPSKSFASFKKPASSLMFEKLDVNNSKEISSNLSTLIQSRFKSININPLVYYSFVDSPVLSDPGTKVLINVFLPPNNQPTIKELKVNPNLVIVDCIGYILLSLSKLPEFEKSVSDTSFLNPNFWRLELVDEDGENYGSFGILDRSRDLASYNNPKEIALCKVRAEEEIRKNETQTPLPMEVKANLAAYSKRDSRASLGNLKGLESSSGQIQSELKDEKVELRILNIPPNLNQHPGGIPFYVSTNWTLMQVLKEFCSQNNLPLRYKFKEVYSTVSDITSSTLSNDTINQTRPVSLQDKVGSLQGNLLMLVPSNDIMNNLQDSSHSFITSITPSESTFSNITPDKKHLEERFDVLSLEKSPSKVSSLTHAASKLRSPGAKDLSKNQTKSAAESEINSNKYLDDIMTGKNPSLPTNLNTIYFKWKVYRKKATILNKIEKSLVLDGDYIHLTPSDDIVFKKNPGENPFTNQSEGNSNNHSHHHIHHYNYNNYYKESMMKTSSFHITQIVKLKQYKNSKNPNHFKIVIQKSQDSSKEVVKKKYDLEAVSAQECQEIMEKLKWVLQVYSML